MMVSDDETVASVDNVPALPCFETLTQELRSAENVSVISANVGWEAICDIGTFDESNSLTATVTSYAAGGRRKSTALKLVRISSSLSNLEYIAKRCKLPAHARYVPSASRITRPALRGYPTHESKFRVPRMEPPDIFTPFRKVPYVVYPASFEGTNVNPNTCMPVDENGIENVVSHGADEASRIPSSTTAPRCKRVKGCASREQSPHGIPETSPIPMMNSGAVSDDNVRLRATSKVSAFDAAKIPCRSEEVLEDNTRCNCEVVKFSRPPKSTP